MMGQRQRTKKEGGRAWCEDAFLLDYKLEKTPGAMEGRQLLEAGKGADSSVPPGRMPPHQHLGVGTSDPHSCEVMRHQVS